MAKHDELLGQGPREAPEPETAGLLAIGLVALALRRRSRNHR